MVSLRAAGTDAGLGEFPQSTVAAVTVAGVVFPPAQDSLSPVGLSDVLLSVAGVGDQVDALHLRQRGLPIDIAVIGNHLPELVESQQYVVESGERFFVAVGDLEDRHSCRLGCASVPASWDVPFHDKSVRQGLHEFGATQIEVAEGRRALGGDFSVVFEGPPQSGASLTVGDQDQPVSLGFGRESSGGVVLAAGVLLDPFLSKVLRAAQARLFAGFEAVPDHADVVKCYRRVVLGADRAQYVAKRQERIRVGCGAFLSGGGVFGMRVFHGPKPKAGPGRRY